jgi:hypothetical protein
MMLEARSFRGLHYNYQNFEVLKFLPKMEYQNFVPKLLIKSHFENNSTKSSIPKMNRKCRELA